MMHSIQKYGVLILLLAPLLLGLSIEHTLDSEYFAPDPVEQSHSDFIVNSLSITMEEISKEDEIHILNTSFLPEAAPYSSDTFISGPKARTVVLVPTPPPDLV